MRSRGAAALAVAASALALIASGCGDDDSGSTTSGGGGGSTTKAADKPVDVAYISYALTDYVQAEQKGLEDAVKPGGGSVRLFNANFDPQKLIQQCQDAVNSGRY